MSRIARAKEMLIGDLRQLVRELAPGGVVRGRIYSTKNPVRNDRRAGSFVIWLTGAQGSWKDYATGEKGDVLDLVAYCKGLERGQALEWAEARYGLTNLSPEKKREFDQAAAVRQRQRDQDEARREKAARRRAFDLWLRGKPRLTGTPAAAYLLNERCIDFTRIPNLARESIRTLERMEWWLGAVRDEQGRKIRSGPEFPALMWAMHTAAGEIGAVHITFVTPEGKKAPVSKPKLIFPQSSGLMMRISHGPSGLDPIAAAAAGVKGPAFVCEGNEDGATAAEADPRLRCLATGGLANLLNFSDLACADSYLVLRDRDWGNGQARELFDRAIARLKGFGKPVGVVESVVGKDINDMARS